jgi:adenine-specific DNA-methyltransferase
MTAVYDYYELAQPQEGVAGGFKYKKVPHVTLGSIVNNEPTSTEILYDQPSIDKSKVRISGPFTVEAVPSPVVKSFDKMENTSIVDSSISRDGETARQDEWRNEFLLTGVRGKQGQKIEFSRIETLQGTRWLHAEGEARDKDSKRVVISFGPQYHPMDQRQVALAIDEAYNLVPKPKLIIFAAFQFDPEAAKDIDELNWPQMTILKVQMNTDLLTSDLKKKRSNNESFLLLGQPDLELSKVGDKFTV